MLLLRHMHFSGYRSYRGTFQLDALENKLPLRPLTLIVGRNGTGKTQVLRLLHQLLASWSDSAGAPLLNQAGGRVFAFSTEDNFHLRSQAHPLSMELGWTFKGEEGHLRLTLAGTWPIDPGQPTALLAWELVQGSERFNGDALPLPWAERPGRALQQALGALWSRSEALAGTRAPLQRAYPMPAPGRRGSLGMRGEGCAAWLHDSAEAARATRTWISENVPPTDLDLDTSNRELRLLERSGGAQLSLADAAEGVHQVLPVVTLLQVRALEGGAWIDTLEQPELHLHDAMHGALGDLLLEAAGLAGARARSDQGQRLVVETHSEGILLRVRRRVAEGAVNPEEVGLAFVDRDQGGSRLRPITLDSRGAVSWWPDGVFLERLGEAKAIAVALRDRDAL